MMKMKLMCPALFLAAIVIFYQGCGTTGGNPVVVRLNSTSYTAKNWLSYLIPSAYASVSDLKFCFKRIRFKLLDSELETGSGNIDFSPGEVTLLSGGNSLGSVTVPSGTYRRIELDLEANCPGSSSGMSVQLINTSGTYTSNDTITIKFEGEFVADQATEVLGLNFQNLVTAMDTVANSSQIKNKLEDSSIKGSY